MSPAETITAEIGRAVEDARRRRNEALGTFRGDDVERDFRKASEVLERYLAGSASVEMGEHDLVGVFDRVGRASSASPLSPWGDRPR